MGVEMNETQVKLMEQYGVLVLPEDVNHAAYELVVEALLFAEHVGHETVVVYCAGMGGELNSALAIADLLIQRKATIGLLPGQADSCHADVWLACEERYVYPMGHMGIHQVKYTFYDKTHVDERYAKMLLHENDHYNRRSARLLARASGMLESHWLEKLDKVGAHGVFHLTADDLISLGIAKPIAAYVASSRLQTSPHVVEGDSSVPEGEPPVPLNLAIKDVDGRVHRVEVADDGRMIVGEPVDDANDFDVYVKAFDDGEFDDPSEWDGVDRD